MTDSYSAAQAARLLGVSERRIRQLAAAGTLSALEGAPLRFDAEVIHSARSKRKQPAARPAPAAAALPVDIVAMAEALADRLMTRALEAQENQQRAAEAVRDRVEQALRDELAATRAELAALRLAAEPAQLPRRSIFGRSKSRHNRRSG